MLALSLKLENMKLRWFDLKELRPELKLKIHKTGRLGFTKAVERFYKFKHNQTVMFGFNESDKKDKSIYATVKDEICEDGFILRKVGDYLYLNTASLFDTIEVDYKNGNFWLIGEEIIFDNKKLFKFTIKERK